ncbi:hypothetical protein KIPB_012297, partial [Kipferlia bialata]|eukprot:g12297.t1
MTTPTLVAILSLGITACIPFISLVSRLEMSGLLADATCADGGLVPNTALVTSQFKTLLVVAVGTILTSALADVTAYSVNVHSRFRLTKNIHQKYFSDRNYYRVTSHIKGIDAPDQRISADSRVAANSI